MTKNSYPTKRQVPSHWLSDPTVEELDTFYAIQAAFAHKTTLVHHDPAKQLYIDLDGSGKRIGCIVYHVKKEPADACQLLAKTDIQPIMFLSKALTAAEL